MLGTAHEYSIGGNIVFTEHYFQHIMDVVIGVLRIWGISVLRVGIQYKHYLILVPCFVISSSHCWFFLLGKCFLFVFVLGVG
jgi:hypothetical protein